MNGHIASLLVCSGCGPYQFLLDLSSPLSEYTHDLMTATHLSDHPQVSVVVRSQGTQSRGQGISCAPHVSGSARIQH